MPSALPNELSWSYSEVLEAARRGDRDAFALLYEATHRRVFGYLLAYLGNPTVAEDLLQEVYMSGLTAIRRFRGRTEPEFLAWTLRIAHAKAIDLLRHRYRHPEVLPGDLDSLQTSDDPQDTVQRRDRIRRLATALAALTADQRDVVVSRMVIGLDLAETSRLVGKKVGSVKALQHRALSRLARLLTEQGETGHA